jgi:hypothetical protein
MQRVDRFRYQPAQRLAVRRIVLVRDLRIDRLSLKYKLDYYLRLVPRVGHWIEQ